MGESFAPVSASDGVSAPAGSRVELGMLRNGLGSIRNLELLLKSIKIGQKGLLSAVTAVHADCAPMIANAIGIAQTLVERGVDTGCAERLSSALSTSLTDLETMLAQAVESGRLSVAQRLKLERDLSHCARELGSTLPLVSLIERASGPRPAESTPVDLIHASSAERGDQRAIGVYRGPEPREGAHAVQVDLEAAKTLVALGVALVTDGDPQGHPRLGFEVAAGGALVTTVELGDAVGTRLTMPALRLSGPSALCAEMAARSLGARFEYLRDTRRVCIYWPLS
jgi:hypothetical protein